MRWGGRCSNCKVGRGRASASELRPAAYPLVTMTTLRHILLSGAACFATASLVSAGSNSLTEFSASDNERLGWGVVDDGVMGGLSQGNLEFTKRGTLVFSGDLSLDNNGGFSSLRTGDLNLDLSDSAGLLARVKGDGRKYQVRLASDARYRGMEVSFMAEFATKKDEWVEVRVPFDQLVGSWRGRSLEEETFNPATVQRLGLILADKKAVHSSWRWIGCEPIRGHPATSSMSLWPTADSRRSPPP